MIKKVWQYIASAPLSDVRAAWIARVRMEHGRSAAIAASMDADGWVRVDVPDDAIVTTDGREVVWIDGVAWVLRPEVHAERLAAAFEATKQASQTPDPETKSVVGTESLSVMVCPKCGDSLQHTAVCPKCAAGKLGYRHRYTCVCGGVDLVSKEAL